MDWRAPGLDVVRVVENALGTFLGALLFALGAGIVGVITLTAFQVITSVATLVFVVMVLLGLVSATRSAWGAREKRREERAMTIVQSMTPEELAASSRLDDPQLPDEERAEASRIVVEAARRFAEEANRAD